MGGRKEWANEGIGFASTYSRATYIHTTYWPAALAKSGAAAHRIAKWMDGSILSDSRMDFDGMCRFE
jgi:hypothetical protein